MARPPPAWVQRLEEKFGEVSNQISQIQVSLEGLKGKDELIVSTLKACQLHNGKLISDHEGRIRRNEKAVYIALGGIVVIVIALGASPVLSALGAMV